MRTANDYRTASKDTYNRFCQANPDIELTFDKWQDIIYTYAYVIRDYILESGDTGKIPFGIGKFTIMKKKPKKTKTDPQGRVWSNLPIDWKSTKEVGKVVYHLNNHTDGYRFRWVWHNDVSRFYMANIWNFKPHRDSSRKLAQFVKRPHHHEIYKSF